MYEIGLLENLTENARNWNATRQVEMVCALSDVRALLARNDLADIDSYR